MTFFPPRSHSADHCLPCTAEPGCCPGCCSTQRWGFPIVSFGASPTIGFPTVNATAAASNTSSVWERRCRHCECWAGLAAVRTAWVSTASRLQQSRQGLFPTLTFLFLSPPLCWFTYLYLHVLVFLLSFPFRSITLQVLIWASSVSPTSLLPPFPTLSPMPPALCSPQLPFCSSCSQSTQQ